MTKERFYFQAGEGLCEEFQVTGFKGSGSLSFSTEDEWYVKVSVEIKREDVKKLASMLNEWLDQ